MWEALTVVLLALVGSIVGIAILAKYLPRAPMFNALVTKPPAPDSVTASVTAAGKPLDSYVGKFGVASTDLRPSGKVEIESDVIDAVAEGEFISKGTGVRVTDASGNRVVVLSSGPGSSDEETEDADAGGGVA